MNFRLEYTPKPFEIKIRHQDRLFLIGSCFTEQIGSKLSASKFRTLENPNGILFNPVSIANALSSYVSDKQYKEEDLFLQNELWGSWDHHTRFSALSSEECLKKINTSQIEAHRFLKSANWLIVTLGSSFVYELADNNKVVANCHKVPTDKFFKRLLSAKEVAEVLADSIYKVRNFNPGIKFNFTISPVRHLRDGFVENNRSKANLISAVHQLVSEIPGAYYFPSYELIIDDLRDYRFFAEDMVHPNYAATNYVWEKFMASCIDSDAYLLMKEISLINAARNHKPFNPGSMQHKLFMESNLQKVQALQKKYDYIDLKDEIEYFGA
ncbi:MAG: GSCFA domain-containing protein [Ferruginibacter sp.]|nr:GSCFA domain-containing protein [Ferruginibacter sp.]